MKKIITSVGLVLVTSVLGISQVGAKSMPSASPTTTVAPATTVSPATTVAAKTPVTTATTIAPKTTTATKSTSVVPVVTESSAGGVITFTVSGSTAKAFEIEDIYKSVTKYHKMTTTSLTLKGSAGKTIKFRVRATSPKSSWSTWQTATVA